MKNQTRLIIIAVLGLIVIILGVFFVKDRVSVPVEQQVSTDEPVNIVLDFYESWAAASRATSTDPYQEGLAKEPLLSKDLSDRLVDSQEQFENGVDPVLCQTTAPQVISSRVSYVLDDEAQILVLSRDEGLGGQSVATLTKYKDGWYISDIACSAGEFGAEREFSFEKDGYLLKSPELATEGNEGIYFIFAENGVFGSASPLFFSPESTCLDGEESVCNTGSFGEKAKAIVRGEMSESGINVKQVEFIEGPLSFE